MPTDLEGLWEKLKQRWGKGGVGAPYILDREEFVRFMGEWVTEHDAAVTEKVKWLEAAFQAERNALAQEVVQHDPSLPRTETLRAALLTRSGDFRLTSSGGSCTVVLVPPALL